MELMAMSLMAMSLMAMEFDGDGIDVSKES